MIVIRHEKHKLEALHLSRHRAIRTAKALNRHEGTIAWGWNYRPVRAGLWRYVIAAYDKQDKIFGYFLEGMLVRQ